MAGTRNYFEDALAAEGVTGQLADVARSIFRQESGSGQNTKTSNAGAKGGMQILDSTFKSVADKDWDINDPLQNARGGIRYLKQLDKQSGGDAALTAAGYYGGPGGLEKARRGIAVSDPRNPNAPNTLQYGAQVAGRLTTGSTPAARQIAAAPVQSTMPEPAVAMVPVAQPAEAVALAPGPVMPTGPDTWAAFNEQMRQQVQVADLDYGRAQPQPVRDYQSMAGYAQPAPTRQAPDFRRFSAMGALTGLA